MEGNALGRAHSWQSPGGAKWLSACPRGYCEGSILQRGQPRPERG